MWQWALGLAVGVSGARACRGGLVRLLTVGAAHLDFPCSTEDLASTLHSINQTLKVQVPASIDQLDESNLGQAIIPVPVSPGESEELVSFFLFWEDQSPEDAWALSQDLIEDQ